MVYYIKVTPAVAKRFADVSLRNATKDGNVLLWMGDLNMVPGATLRERAEYVGGALLSGNDAAEEYLGTVENPAPCHTPEYLGGEPSTASVDSPKAEEIEASSESKSDETYVGSGNVVVTAPANAGSEEESSDNVKNKNDKEE